MRTRSVALAFACAPIGAIAIACSSNYAAGDAPVDAGAEAKSDAGPAPDGSMPDAAVPRGTHLFSKSFGGPEEDYLTRANVDVSGNLLLAGTFADTLDFGTGPITTKGANDMYFAKLDPKGAGVFATTFGDGDEQDGVNMVGTGSGDLYATGCFRGTVTLPTGPATATDTAFDALLVRLGSDGTIKETSVIGGAGVQLVYGLAYDGSRGVFFSGINSGTIPGPIATAGGNDVVAGHSMSTQNWTRDFGDPSEQFGNDVAYDPAGDVVAVGWYGGTVDFGGGTTFASVGGYDAFVARFTPAGAPVWSRSFGGAGDQQAWFVRVGADGAIFVLGQFTGTMTFASDITSAGGLDLFLAKLASDGKPIWAKRFGGAADEGSGGLAIAPNGDILIAGRTSGDLDFGLGALPPAGDADGFVARLDKDGNPIWAKRFGDAGFQSVQGVGVTLSNEVWIAGYFTGTIDLGGGPLTSNGKHDVFAARFTP